MRKSRVITAGSNASPRAVALAVALAMALIAHLATGQVADAEAHPPVVAGADATGTVSGRSLPSWWLKRFRLGPARTAAYRDPDLDGLSNRYEFRLRINPRRKDTDRDGMEDGIEVRFGFNPRRPDADEDEDHDGISNIDETRDHAPEDGGSPQPGFAVDPRDAQEDTDRRGLFVVNCPRTERKMLDPIMAPGMPGMSHSHDFFGPRVVADEATPADLIEQPTSCGFDSDRSAYWMPTLYNAGMIQEGGVLQAYYFVGQRARAFPRGLAMVAGNPRLAASNPQSASWSCQPSTAYGQATLPRCEPEQYVLSEIRFPSCWNGRDLDVADHRSHMAYPVGGHCPASHPVELPELVLFRTFTQYDRLLDDATLASGSTGGLHGDFVSGWDEASLGRLLDACRERSCGVVR